MTYPMTLGDEKSFRLRKQQLSDMFRVAGQTKESLGGKRCLELGCGTGEETLMLVKEFGLTVTAIEYNPKSVEYARALAAHNGIEGKATFVCQDLNELDLGDAQFDIVFSKGVLHHLKDPQKALRRALSYLAPGGACVFRVNWLYGWMFKGNWNYATLKLLYLLFSDPQKRMRIGERYIHDQRKVNSNMPQEVVIYDNYGSIYRPMRLAWFLARFRECGVAYRASSPPHELRPLIARRYPAFADGMHNPPPSLFSRALVQTLYMFVLRNQLTLTVAGAKLP